MSAELAVVHTALTRYSGKKECPVLLLWGTEWLYWIQFCDGQAASEENVVDQNSVSDDQRCKLYEQLSTEHVECYPDFVN